MDKFVDPLRNTLPHGCTVCGKVLNKFGELAEHIKTHRISFSRYANACWPKTCLLSREIIASDSLEQYLLQYFKNKSFLNEWVRNNLSNRDLVSSFIELILKRYILLKQWKSCPPYLIFSSIQYLPTILTIERAFGHSFDVVADKLKIVRRLQYRFDETLQTSNKTIVVDTREQKPLNLKGSTIREKVDYGDYCLTPFSGVSVERKSLSDFVSTLSGGFERFERELQGAKKEKWNLVVLVESPLNTALSFDRGRSFGRATPAFIFHRMRTLIQEHEHVQFLFVDGRIEAARLVPIILNNWSKLKKYDLQYVYRKGKL